MKVRIAAPTIAEIVTIVENGDVDEALRILEVEDAVNVNEPCGLLQITLVHIAAWRGELRILKLLNDRVGANLNATDKLGRCALHHAAHQGHVEVVRWLLEHGADVEARFGVTFSPKNEPYSVVGTASPSCNVGRNLPLPECWGRTALHQAVKAGHVDIVRILVEAGANVDVQDDRGVTPLHLAAVTVNPNDSKQLSRFEKVIDILVSASASVNIVHRDTGTTALHHAVTLGHREATKRLLEGGACPTARCTGTGITPLHIAASGGFHDTLCILLKYLDISLVDVRDEVGRTPVHAAAYQGHPKCVRVLVDHGGSLAAETKTGVTVIDAIFGHIGRPIAFLTEILNARVRATDKEVNQVNLDFRVLAPRNELQMAVVSALLAAVPSMEQMTILQHPLLEAYLGMKWLRLRRFFFLLVIIHVNFVISLSGYALILLKEITDTPILRWTLFLCACILIGHNLLQILIVPRHHRWQFETWLSLICVTTAAVVAVAGEYHIGQTEPAPFNETAVQHHQSSPPSWVLQCVSITILFAWIQMMLLVGRFPTWGYYALMFSTVLKNVAKVLLAFIWLIVGFALSFLVLFHKNNQFDDSWRAVVKTVVMMMGEYEYGSLFNPADDRDDSLLPIISRIVFLIFVMLASIVLMNLMIGLAVNDIQGLLKEGYIRRLLKQAEFVAHLEWVTSHRIFRVRLLDSCLRAILESRNTIPTRITLRMFTGYRRSTNGIAEELVDALFELALKNRDSDKELKRELPDVKTRQSLAETMLSLQEEVEELHLGTTRTQLLRSSRRKIGRRRKSTAI